MEPPIHNARDIYNLSKEDVWNLPDGKMILDFEDGVLETTMRATVFSWYMGVFHRLHPNTPLLKRHHLGDNIIGKNTHLDILGYGLFDTIDVYGDNVDVEELSKIAFQTGNLMYNDFTTRLKAFVSTISILDFVDVMNHPDIHAVNSNVKSTQLSIDQTYSVISSTLNDRKDPHLVGNTLGRMAKSRLVPMGQIQQCIGPRGYLTDIDSNIFREPILTGFVSGIKILADSMKESRSAAKALTFAADKVSDTEYFNREMQLLASIVTRVHVGDCGSTEYLAFRVDASDLSRIAGKLYIDEKTNKLTEVRETDRQLIGSIIKLRSSLKCRHPDSYGICSTCFGTLANSIPKFTNMGHISATVMCEKISQNVLSTKHLDGSSKVDDFIISDFDSKYIRVSSEVTSNKDGEPESNTIIKFAAGLRGKKFKLILPEEEAKNLSDIDYHALDKIVPSVITKLKEVMIQVEDKEGYSETVTVPVSMRSRLSWLTIDALEFIKHTGWIVSDKGNYVIDMTDWDIDQSLFQLPLKHTDMAQYMSVIKSFVFKTGKKDRGLGKVPSVDKTMIDFYNLINSKLSVNLAHLEIIMLASMVNDIPAKDHRLPESKEHARMAPFKENMKLRSMGPSMAYQGQAKLLTSVSSFIHVDRPDSLFDNLLCPYPVINPRE